MVNFYVDSVEKGMKIGADAAAYVSDKFINPIKIEFEKVSPIVWIILNSVVSPIFEHLS